jgi:hypothetical protein
MAKRHRRPVPTEEEEKSESASYSTSFRKACEKTEGIRRKATTIFAIWVAGCYRACSSAHCTTARRQVIHHLKTTQARKLERDAEKREKLYSRRRRLRQV